MDYNLGLLGDPEELKKLLAAAQLQPEDRSSANAQALIALGSQLMGARKGQEFDAIGRGAMAGLGARNNALNDAQQSRSRALLNTRAAQEVMSSGRKMAYEDEDRQRSIAQQQEFQAMMAQGAPSPLANGKGPTLENAAAQTQQMPDDVALYRKMAKFYASKQNPEQAKKMSDIADGLEEKYGNTPTAVKLPDGSIAYAQFGSKGGRKIAEGVAPAEKLHFSDTGDMVGVGQDPFTGKPVAPGLTKNMSATERDASARGWSSNNLAKEQFAWNRQKDMADMSYRADERNQKRTDTAEKQLKGRESVDTNADIILNKVDEALGNVNWRTTGAIGAGMGMIPGRDAYDLKGTVDTIKARLGFKELQEMRAASPTGGALGQVAVQELEFLQASIANLDHKQGTEAVQRNLAQIKQHIENWKRVSGSEGQWKVRVKGQ